MKEKDDVKDSSDAIQTTDFFKSLNRGKQIASKEKFVGLTLKNRQPHEMICDCCGSTADCCGFN